MDFKGITWAGNMYQKFEEMCLEVEEVMYEVYPPFYPFFMQIVCLSYYRRLFKRFLEFLSLSQCDTASLFEKT